MCGRLRNAVRLLVLDEIAIVTAAVRTVLARESALLEMVRRVLAEELPGRGGIIAVRTRERLGDSIGVSLAFVSLFHEKA